MLPEVRLGVGYVLVEGSGTGHQKYSSSLKVELVAISSICRQKPNPWPVVKLVAVLSLVTVSVPRLRVGASSPCRPLVLCRRLVYLSAPHPLSAPRLLVGASSLRRRFLSLTAPRLLVGALSLPLLRGSCRTQERGRRQNQLTSQPINQPINQPSMQSMSSRELPSKRIQAR